MNEQTLVCILSDISSAVSVFFGPVTDISVTVTQIVKVCRTVELHLKLSSPILVAISFRGSLNAGSRKGLGWTIFGGLA